MRSIKFKKKLLCATTCKIAAATDKKCGNESKNCAISKNSFSAFITVNMNIEQLPVTNKFQIAIAIPKS